MGTGVEFKQYLKQDTLVSLFSRRSLLFFYSELTSFPASQARNHQLNRVFFLVS